MPQYTSGVRAFSSFSQRSLNDGVGVEASCNSSIALIIRWISFLIYTGVKVEQRLIESSGRAEVSLTTGFSNAGGSLTSAFRSMREVRETIFNISEMKEYNNKLLEA